MNYGSDQPAARYHKCFLEPMANLIGNSETGYLLDANYTFCDETCSHSLCNYFVIYI